MQNNQNPQQAGFSLIEVLISVVILSVGLLALAGFNGNLYKSVAYSSQRAKAITSAQLKIDNARSQDLATLTTGSDPGSCSDSNPHRSWTVTSVAGLSNVKDFTVYVCWTDSTGVKQEMSVATQIGIATAAIAAAAPTATPTAAATPAPCDYPAYATGANYTSSSIVKNVGHKYQCKVDGWCPIAPAHYAPGTGSAWNDAWTDLGVCE